MKKIIYMSVIFATLFVNAALAEAAIRIEGEKYRGKSNIDCIKENNSAYSSGIAAILSKDAPTSNGTLTYKFTADEAGEYSFCGMTSVLGVNGNDNMTDYYLEINGRQLHPKDYSLVDNSATSISGKAFRKYTYPAVNLKAGENVLKVSFEKNDLTYLERKMSAYIDYFEFEKNDVEFSVNKFDNEANAFYNTDDVKITLRTHNYASEDTKLWYIARDSEGIPQKMDIFTIAKGSDSAELDLNSLPNGWYSIKIYDDEFESYTGVETKITISDVVSGLNKSIAVDTAGYILMNEPKFELFRGYMVKAGIGTARDRTILGYPDYAAFQNFQQGYDEDGIDVSIAYDKEYNENFQNKTVNFYEDLTEVYQKGVDLSSCGRSGNIYEIFNEADGSFAYSPADLYAAYFKAAAIGVTDGNADAYKGFCGLASPGDQSFNTLIQQNDIMRYSDFYNYHTHHRGTGDSIQYPSSSMKKSHIDLKNAYAVEKPIFVTEAGYYMDTTNSKMLEGQAKFFITQLVKSKIMGDDRIFFFTLPNYLENGSTFGVFDENLLPRPVYAAISETAAMLGKSEYKGVLSGLPEGAVGAMFNDGTNDVAVLIANDGERFQFRAGEGASIVDFRGREQTLYTSTTGMANIEINNAPLFIKFNGLSNEDNYYKSSIPAKDIQKSTFDTNDRIVIRQDWKQDLKNAKENGYSVVEGGSDVNIEVYNFNDTDIDVTITMQTEKGFAVSDETAELTVPAKGKAVKTVKVTTTDLARTEAFFRIDGIVGGNAVSPSVSRMKSEVGDSEVTIVHTFDEANNKNNWNTDNRGYPSTASVENITDGVNIVIDLTSSTTGGYAYPTFTVQNPSALAGTDGICFDRTTAAGSGGATDVFLYTINGSFHLGNYITFVEGQEKIILEWSDFVVYSSNDELVPENIRRIGIGMQGNAAAEYSITNLCAFTADFAEKRESIVINNLEEDKRYYDLKYVDAQLPAKEYASISVMIDGVDREYILNENNEMKIPVTELERGYYNLQIVAKDAMNRADTKSVRFYVE